MELKSRGLPLPLVLTFVCLGFWVVAAEDAKAEGAPYKLQYYMYESDEPDGTMTVNW